MITGLAAPAIAAGMAAIGSAVPILGAGGLSAAAAVAGSATGSAAVAASFGAAGARLTGMKMARRISDIDELDLHGIENVHLSEMVDGHTSYLTSLKHILQGFDIDSLYATQPHKPHMSEEDKKNTASTAAGPAPQ